MKQNAMFPVFHIHKIECRIEYKLLTHLYHILLYLIYIFCNLKPIESWDRSNIVKVLNLHHYVMLFAKDKPEKITTGSDIVYSEIDQGQ